MTSSETTFNDEPFYVIVTEIEEHENGAATYSFEMSDDASTKLANLGLEFSLHCAAYELDLQYVLDNISHLADKYRQEKGDTP